MRRCRDVAEEKEVNQEKYVSVLRKGASFGIFVENISEERERIMEITKINKENVENRKGTKLKESCKR